MITSRADQDRAAVAHVARRAYLRDHPAPYLLGLSCPSCGAEPGRTCHPGAESHDQGRRTCSARVDALAEARSARLAAGRAAGQRAADERHPR